MFLFVLIVIVCEKEYLCQRIFVLTALSIFVTVSCNYDGLVFGVFMLFVLKYLVQLVDTTVEIANKVGASEIINCVVDDLKDENERYRKMVMETIEKITGNIGAADIDTHLEEQIIDGILYAFQEQTSGVM